MKNLEQRIQKYAERHFLRSGMTSWPTISEVSHGIKVGMKRIHEEVEFGELCDTQGFFFFFFFMADIEIYTHTEKIEEKWQAYWAIFNGPIR